MYGYNDRIFPWLVLSPIGTPPDPTIADDKKDASYDNKWARYYASTVQDTYINWFRLQYVVNTNFARGAWGIAEDRLTFLKDGQKETTRKELSLPIVPPMVLRLSGQAASLAISAKAVAVTQYAKTRQEMNMNRAVAMTMMAQQGQYVNGAVQEFTGYDSNEVRTRIMAESSFQDKETQVANSLMTMQERENNYEGIRNGYAPIVSCSGMFALHCERDGMDLRWSFCNPMDVAWDTSTNRPDLQGSFMIHAPRMSMSEIARRFPLKKEEVKKLYERIKATFGTGASWPQNEPRVMTVYYKDPQWTTLGWVMNGEKPKLVDLKATNEDGSLKWKDSDLIEPPQEGPYGKYGVVWKGKKYSSFIEQIRYCTFIPFEYTPLKTPNNNWNDKNNADLILANGVCDLQDVDPAHPYRTSFPIKMSTCQYINGFIIAPVTAAIAPQRVANLVTSDLVWRMEKAGNMSPVFDSRALAGSKMTLQEIMYAQKEGNPIELDGSVAGGLNNAISRSDASLPQSFYQMWQVPQMISGYAQMGTGIQDANLGRSQGQDQLVGTTQLLLQQSNTMMQPFIQCWTEGFRQVHQFDVQAGKNFYIKMPWALADKIGDEGVETVMQGKHMALEQFRADIEISVNSTQLKAATDQMILQFLQLGLLDAATAAELGGQSYPSDVWNGAKAFTRQQQQAAVAQAEAQAQQAQMQGMAAQDQALQEREDDLYAEAYKLLGSQAKLDQKAYQPFAQRIAEAQIPVPSEQAEMQAATPGT